MKPDLFGIQIAGYGITLGQGRGGKERFRVIYGLQVDDHLSYSEACKKLGEAILHALACEGKIDDQMEEMG